RRRNGRRVRARASPGRRHARDLPRAQAAAPQARAVRPLTPRIARIDGGLLQRDRKGNRMSEGAIVSEEFAKKFATEKETPYTRWVRDEGLDIISSFYVSNLHTVELKPWPRRGARGVFLNHDASRTSNDCYEIGRASCRERVQMWGSA